MARLVLGFFVLCSLSIYASADEVEICGQNEVLTPCGKDCELKCPDGVVKPCDGDIATCPLQCRCADGYGRYAPTGLCHRACPRS